ncbi:MAG: YggS family pyridoxal phosphate-dependent enzyme [Lysobacter sp.]
MDNASRLAGRPSARLLAVSKLRPAAAIADLASALRSFDRSRMGAATGGPGLVVAIGENYVQEARAKQAQLRDPALEWHLIGHLQSNKAQAAADLFDWIQTVDRPTLVAALAKHRPAQRPPLNVLIQVNIDDEASKHGCIPGDVPSLAAAIAAQSRLRLRGLMAIPAPSPDPLQRRDAFRRMWLLFEALLLTYPRTDTLSMGMSEDLELAIAEGATMVRVGSALFGRRDPAAPDAAS